ncbi:MAG: hypothetical protein U5Q03_20175 [Bacteroidota bacterium]|nr:hypothetical protein [Bacteroidota bacterium]
MMIVQEEKKDGNLIYWILGAFTIVMIFCISYFKGTGDNGDSILHYLFARYAFEHPGNFFDHWAKPFYVLLAAPFAQLGFDGIKAFNALNTLMCIYFTYRIALILGFKNPLVLPLLMLFSPLYFILSFSGLTEPLFAFMLALSVFLLLKEFWFSGYLLASFLPFVRSEGLVILGVFGLYALMKRHWKYLPALLLGHVLYSVAGSFFHGDLLWVFSKIPYASMDSVYGSGSLLHFFEKLLYVLGVPVYFLFWLGYLVTITRISRRRARPEESILIFAGFTGFFIAHSLFWYLGIFHSMGLNRVFLAVMPLMGIMALSGFSFITDLLSFGKPLLKKLLIAFLLVYIIVFPLTNNPAAINWKKDMMKTQEAFAAEELAAYLKESELANQRLVYVPPQISLSMQRDHFDARLHLLLTPAIINHLVEGDVVIWDNWFAITDMGLERSVFDRDDSFALLREFRKDADASQSLYVVYQKR